MNDNDKKYCDDLIESYENSNERLRKNIDNLTHDLHRNNLMLEALRNFSK